ncbi:50S ribosomal protein L13 [Patescibacteria group bacterium]|nr:50S ribosomal protein L13 [Patescibacteria group bacterium]
MTTHKIDAKEKRIGRIASEAAQFLMGKNTVTYVRNQIPEITVSIENASKMQIDAGKREKNKYIHYTGYPSGLRTKTMDQVILKKGYSELLRKAVYGMLPSNKLRPRMMKNLNITE